MSKINVSIPIQNLPKEVLKNLLSVCDEKSLQDKNIINEPIDVDIEFLYDYNKDITKRESDAIVFFASKEDVENEINERKIY